MKAPVTQSTSAGSRGSAQVRSAAAKMRERGKREARPVRMKASRKMEGKLRAEGCQAPSRPPGARRRCPPWVRFHVRECAGERAGMEERVGVEQNQIPALGCLDGAIVGHAEAEIDFAPDEPNRNARPENSAATISAEPSREALSTTRISAVAPARQAGALVAQRCEALAQQIAGVERDNDDRDCVIVARRRRPSALAGSVRCIRGDRSRCLKYRRRHENYNGQSQICRGYAERWPAAPVARSRNSFVVTWDAGQI